MARNLIILNCSLGEANPLFCANTLGFTADTLRTPWVFTADTLRTPWVFYRRHPANTLGFTADTLRTPWVLPPTPWKIIVRRVTERGSIPNYLIHELWLNDTSP